MLPSEGGGITTGRFDIGRNGTLVTNEGSGGEGGDWLGTIKIQGKIALYFPI